MLLDHLKAMRHSPAHNYVIPGLTSWLIGTPHPHFGCVRMFSMSRLHEEPIIPHSHRFDFRCVVLQGSVRQRIWTSDACPDPDSFFQVSTVTYEGELGKHTKTSIGTSGYSVKETVYKEGSQYGMKAEEIHSIYFSKGAEVLFFEGLNRLDNSVVLEPVVHNQVIPLFKTEPWMFDKTHYGN